MATLNDLVALAEEQLNVQYRIDELEEQLSEAKKHYRRLSENEIPELMDEIGIDSFALKNGRSVRVQSKYVAHITKEKKPIALQWLRDHGFGGLIKRKVVTEFSRGEDGVAESLLNELSSRSLYVYDDASVHHNTLRAFVREQLEQGNEVPEDIFGVLEIREAVIK